MATCSPALCKFPSGTKLFLPKEKEELSSNREDSGEGGSETKDRESVELRLACEVENRQGTIFVQLGAFKN